LDKSSDCSSISGDIIAEATEKLAWARASFSSTLMRRSLLTASYQETASSLVPFVLKQLMAAPRGAQTGFQPGKLHARRFTFSLPIAISLLRPVFIDEFGLYSLELGFGENCQQLPAQLQNLSIVRFVSYP
jgi:hypothetical protein